MEDAPKLLHFLHTPDFDRSLDGIMADDELAELQNLLCRDPKAGATIAGTGGIRKIRIGARGRGQRGGARVIYYYHDTKSRIYLLLAYSKNEADDLSEAGKKYLKKRVTELREVP